MKFCVCVVYVGGFRYIWFAELVVRNLIKNFDFWFVSPSLSLLCIEIYLFE